MAKKPTTNSPAASAEQDTGSSLVPELPKDEHEEELIDEALTETFPASDPVSVPVPKRKSRRRRTTRAAQQGE